MSSNASFERKRYYDDEVADWDLGEKTEADLRTKLHAKMLDGKN
jgi:hypothetical protein